MENKFMDAMHFRHACKVFDENKRVSDKDINTILETGRLSPSSFGIEPWKFLVITNQELKEKLKPFCWNQPQITTCSHLVVVLAAIENAKVEGGKVKERFARWKLPEEKMEFYINLYSNHLQKTLSNNENIYYWTAKQTYIAAANMMTAAAYIGIDSCPIEGFEKENVEKILGLDTSKFQLSLIIPFGYRINPQQQKTRLDFNEIIEFID